MDIISPCAIILTCEPGRMRRKNDEELGPAKKRAKLEAEDHLAHDKPTESALALMNYMPAVKDDLFVVTKIGSGTFSAVYLCYRRDKETNLPGEKLALKCIIPTCHPDRIAIEIKCLRRLGGSNNVMGMMFCTKYNNKIVIGMPYFPHDVFSTVIKDMTIAEIRLYMKNLLIALAHIHRIGIIHRDLKPINFLYNRARKTFSLIDFGLAQCARKSQSCGQKLSGKSPPKVVPKAGNVGNATGTAKRTILGDLSPSKLNLMSQNSVAKRTQAANKEKGFLMLSMATQPGITKTIAGVQVSTHSTGSKVAVRSSKCKATSNANGQNESKVCNCFAKPEFCHICNVRKRQVAPRAGTPGFRSPEVLLKHPDQTTAVDMWSAGVIFLCMLTRRYPFFRAPDDLTALAEITTLFGSSAMKWAAKHLNKDLICRPEVTSMDLSDVIPRLRNNVSDGTVDQEFIEEIPSEAYSFLTSLMELNHVKRVTAVEALQHEFLTM